MSKKAPLDWETQRDEYVKQFVFKPKTKGQEYFYETMQDFTITICTGPPGTGKTTLAAWLAADMLKHGEIDRIVLTRPAVECGETLGYLPGNVEEKISPYLMPLLDAINQFFGPKKAKEFLGNGTIELFPLQLMRGRTFNNTFAILDEASSATYEQIRMFLTRIGFNSKMVVCGDLGQSDLMIRPCPLETIIEKLGEHNDIGYCALTNKDIVRHKLISYIEKKLG